MELSTGLSIIAILFSSWSIYLGRRSTRAAEQSVKATQKGSDAAERSALAAEKSAAEAREATAVAREELELSKQKADEERLRERSRKIDELVREGIRDWPDKGNLIHITDREIWLTDEEIAQLVSRVLLGSEKTLINARMLTHQVLERRDALRQFLKPNEK